MAMFTFIDDLREDAGALVDTLQRMGKSVLLMTGDRNAAARQVAELTGIDDYRAQMSPQEKMEAVQALQSANASVMMVGDGVNDAPVLSSANEYIAKPFITIATHLHQSDAKAWLPFKKARRSVNWSIDLYKIVK
jgi:P-type E1-E2 ATPase